MCAASFDHLVGGREERRRHGEAKQPGGLGVDNQLELARLHDRQVRGLGALEDATRIDAHLTPRIWKAGSVAHQAAGFGIFTRCIYRGDRVARRQVGQLDTPAGEKGVAGDEKPGFSRTRVAKAASISRLVLALKIWICNPTARAAASTSLNVDSVFIALAGFTSTATRVTAGSN